MRAQEARGIAALLEGEAREEMLKRAAGYEAIAEKAKTWRTGSESGE
jgi:hypothetical protein